MIYKKYDVVDQKYYQAPSWFDRDFSGIEFREITIQAGDRLDIIAQQIYGNSEYWKILAIYNDIGYFFQLKPGDKLYLPLRIQDVMDRL
jgi:hypothetical protein